MTVVVVMGVFFLWLSASVYFLQVLEQTQTHQTELDLRDSENPNIDPSTGEHSRLSWKTLRGGLQQQLQQRFHPSTTTDTATTTTRKDTVSNSKGVTTRHKKEENREIIDMRILASELAFDNPDGGAWKQGWEVEPMHVSLDTPLEIIVVPHSHCDPGWIKTFDEYFQKQVKEIISTVVESLVKDSRRTFVWAEISYFEWWWKEQNEAVREQVRGLFKSKQLEFVTGGWVMPDEANSELYAMEMQLQEGHDWIRSTLGAEYIPEYSWSIDPFGYSPTMAWLLNKYGFKGMLIQRVHYAVKKELASKLQLEFTWRQVWDDGENGNGKDVGTHDIFAHLMPFFSYDVPHTCGPDPAVCCQFDFKRDSCPWHKKPQPITKANIKERSLLLLDQYKKKAALYRSNTTVLIPLGDDFRYQTHKEAEAQFTNYQAIFDYLNKNVPGVNAHFGTLSEYFKKVQGTFEPPILKGSFFTYSDVDDHYWSGYFTSRAFDKALDRQLERVLYAATELGGSKEELQKPRRTLSLFQHHDGVTGTAKDFVVEDYAKRIHSAISFTQNWMVDRLQQKFAKLLLPAVLKPAGVTEGGTGDTSSIQPCWVSNAPRGLSHNLCGDEGTVYVYNPLDLEQSCGDVVVPGKKLVAAELPCELPGSAPASNSRIVFDEITGLMTEPIREEWKVWKVTEGGAYLFFPGQLRSYDLKGDDANVELGGYVVTTEFWKRTVVEREVPTKFGTTATVIDFIYETNLNQDNEEWFVRFRSANIANGGVFHTDLNGFNFDTHHFRSDLPIQSQVFPMPTLASIEDDSLRMTVLSEHAQGTASLQDGSIDVWLDRRLAQDDNLGMGQPIRDNVPTRTRLRLVLEQDGYDSSGEFQVTPLGRQVWDELQHPLEMFGKHTKELEAAEGGGDGPPADYDTVVRKARQRQKERAGKRDERARERVRNLLEGDNEEAIGGAKGTFARLFNGFFGEHLDIEHNSDIKLLVDNHHEHHGHHGKQKHHRKKRGESVQDQVPERFTVENTTVPLVFMVFKRVEYFQKAIESLRKSDFPKSRIPLIISHDGHVPEMVEYVETLKKEFQVIQIFHPYSCFEHPDTFPGDDKELNKDYKGDRYGNPRSPWATCCKHHFTWMLKTIFEMKFDSLQVDNFLLLEEDYIVAPTVYSTIASGLNVMAAREKELDDGFFGIALDPTEADNQVRILLSCAAPVLLLRYSRLTALSYFFMDVN